MSGAILLEQSAGTTSLEKSGSFAEAMLVLQVDELCVSRLKWAARRYIIY